MKLTVLLDHPQAALAAEPLMAALRSALGTRLRGVAACISADHAGKDAAYEWLAAACSLRDGAALAALLAARKTNDDGCRYEVTPCHWQLARDHAILAALDNLSAEHAQTLLASANQTLAVEMPGARLDADANGWYLAAPFDLPGTSFACAVATPTVLALGDDDAARQVRLLINLVQMAWHEHPVNQARESVQQLAVNAVWLHGGKVPAPPFTTTFDSIVDTRHRAKRLSSALEMKAASEQHSLIWLDAGRDALAMTHAGMDQRLHSQLEQLARTIEALPAGAQVEVLLARGTTLTRTSAHIASTSLFSRMKDALLPGADLAGQLLQLPA